MRVISEAELAEISQSGPDYLTIDLFIFVCAHCSYERFLLGSIN